MADLPESWLALFRAAERIISMTDDNEGERLLDLAVAIDRVRREHHIPPEEHDA